MTAKNFVRRYQTGASLFATAILDEDFDVEGHAMIGDREFKDLVALLGDVAVRLSAAQRLVLLRILEVAADPNA
jgi:hypothetical protein